jgi:hypothetical protein
LVAFRAVPAYFFAKLTQVNKTAIFGFAEALALKEKKRANAKALFVTMLLPEPTQPHSFSNAFV